MWSETKPLYYKATTSFDCYNHRAFVLIAFKPVRGEHE